MHRHSNIIKAKYVRMVDKDGNPVEQPKPDTYITDQQHSLPKVDSLLYSIATSKQSSVDNLVECTIKSTNETHEPTAEILYKDKTEVDKMVNDICSLQ